MAQVVSSKLALVFAPLVYCTLQYLARTPAQILEGCVPKRVVPIPALRIIDGFKISSASWIRKPLVALATVVNTAEAITNTVPSNSESRYGLLKTAPFRSLAF